MRLVAGFPLRRPGLEPGLGHVGFVVDKWNWGRFSPSTSVFPANSHSTNCYTIIIIVIVIIIIIIYHLGLVH
jgi:hypothetical protein